MITKQKRNIMESLVYEVFDALDPTETNSEKYREMFSDMSDTQFDSFFKDFFKDDDLFLTLDIVDYERDLTIYNIEKAAKILNVPLLEKVVMPFANMNKEHPTITKYEVPVGYLHLKRMQQMLFKKNSQSTDISMRSATTGQRRLCHIVIYDQKCF